MYNMVKKCITPQDKDAFFKSSIQSKLIYLWFLLPNPLDKIVEEKFMFSVYLEISKTNRISKKIQCQV